MLSYKIVESLLEAELHREVVLRGSAVSDHSFEAQRVLSTAMCGCRSLVIDLRALMEMDMAFFLKICLLHRTAETLGIAFSVRGALSESPISQGQGASRTRGCLFSCHSECLFWAARNEPDVEGAGTCPGLLPKKRPASARGSGSQGRGDCARH